MVYVEQVVDGFGVVNYDCFLLSNWLIMEFCLLGLVCQEVLVSVVVEEYDLFWLRECGFELFGLIWME